MTLQLAHSVVRGPDSQDDRLCTLVHGVFGSGMNLRTLARRLGEQNPSWWFLLPDLRGHGNSPRIPGPHTLQACGEDILRLERSHGAKAKLRVGHSFGGKVVLACHQREGGAHTVLLDSLPSSAEPGSGPRVWLQSIIESLRGVPVPLESRELLAEHLGSYGRNPVFLGWMKTNLVLGERGGYGWRFDFPTVLELLRDYWEQNYEALMHSAPSEFSMYYGARSDRFDRQTIEVLEGWGLCELDSIPDAGHWVHVDNPEGTIQVLNRDLSHVRRRIPV